MLVEAEPVPGVVAKQGLDAVGPLGRLLQKGDDIVPIPGTKQLRYLEENMHALEVELTQPDLQEIDEVV